MKITRRLLLRCTGALAACMALTGASAQGSFWDWLRRLFGMGDAGAAGGASSAASAASLQPESAAPPPLPPYDADPLTGEAKTGRGRMVGVMVNNISNSARQNARPQRGLSAAPLLIESRVEGNISRLCAVYSGVDAIPEVGPLRSGRDQFLQLLMPWQALYYHDGESFEHTEFTSGPEIREAAQNAGIGLTYDYDATFFPFADYRTGAEELLESCAAARQVTVRHSANYQSAFRYSEADRAYRMQMYSARTRSFEDAVDELNGAQLAFENLLVCFAPIAAYAGDSGDVQEVQYIAGGDAWLFTRGRARPCQWSKPAPDLPLQIADGAETVLLNRGRTYLAIVDVDEQPAFTFNA